MNASQAEWVNQTTLHPLAGMLLVGMAIATLLLSRRFAALPILITACFISPAQRVVILNLDFNTLRIMVVAGWVRLMLRNETDVFRVKTLDVILPLWALWSLLARTICHGTLAVFVNGLGDLFDAVGMYFLFRCLVRDWEEVRHVVRGLVLVSIPVMLAFLVENATGRNAFAVFGGVPEITLVRQGSLRCQGAFSHPIMAGCFFASLMPMICACWWGGKGGHVYAAAGLLSCATIVLLCASSTPLMVVIAGLFGGCLFLVRKRMRYVFWGALLIILALHWVMKAPVWHLLSRTDLVAGSTGWHRFFLVDQTVNRLAEWWAFGTGSTTSWGHNLGDITNQYVLQAVTGGAVGLALFITILMVAFRAASGLSQGPQLQLADRAMAWALWVSLLGHCVAFAGVSYFGQIVVEWFLLLAVIGSLAAARPRVPRRPPREWQAMLAGAYGM